MTSSATVKMPKAKITKPPSSDVTAATGPDSDNTRSPSTSTIDTVTVKTEDDTSTTTTTTSSTSVTSHEPRTEIREGIEWVSFVYSHHRVLRRYSIRTDIEKVDLNQLEESFKNENCVSFFSFTSLCSNNLQLGYLRCTLVQTYLVKNIREIDGHTKQNATHWAGS